MPIALALQDSKRRQSLLASSFFVARSTASVSIDCLAFETTSAVAVVVRSCVARMSAKSVSTSLLARSSFPKVARNSAGVSVLPVTFPKLLPAVFGRIPNLCTERPASAGSYTSITTTRILGVLPTRDICRHPKSLRPSLVACRKFESSTQRLHGDLRAGFRVGQRIVVIQLDL